MAALTVKGGERRGRAFATSSPDWEVCGCLTSDPNAIRQVHHLVGYLAHLVLGTLWPEGEHGLAHEVGGNAEQGRRA